jgi:hypothetical protein
MKENSKKVTIINFPSLGTIESIYYAPDFVRLALASSSAYLRGNGDFEIQLIDAKYTVTEQDFIYTKLEFVKYQRDEVKRTKMLRPNLLASQQMNPKFFGSKSYN